MIFGKILRSRIWEITQINCGTWENDVKPHVPQYEEIVVQAVNRLRALGLSVTRTSPKKCNAVIRVFRHENVLFQGRDHFIWGIDIFIKTKDGIMSKYQTRIKYSTYELQWFAKNGDSIDIRPHFVDYFVSLEWEEW